MITQFAICEWQIEPESPDCREYARLDVRANEYGLLIDGQGLIPWPQLWEAHNYLELKRQVSKNA